MAAANDQRSETVTSVTNVIGKSNGTTNGTTNGKGKGKAKTQNGNGDDNNEDGGIDDDEEEEAFGRELPERFGRGSLEKGGPFTTKTHAMLKSRLTSLSLRGLVQVDDAAVVVRGVILMFKLMVKM